MNFSIVEREAGEGVHYLCCLYSMMEGKKEQGLRKFVYFFTKQCYVQIISSKNIKRNIIDFSLFYCFMNRQSLTTQTKKPSTGPESCNISGPIEKMLFCYMNENQPTFCFNFQQFILKTIILFVICINADNGLLLFFEG